MSLAKKAAAGLASVGMAAGLTVAGAGAASAAVPHPHIAGNTVNVHVTAPLPNQTCMGMLVPPYAAADLAGAAVSGGGNLMPIIAALGNNPDVIALNGPGLPGIFQLPVTIPGQDGWLSAQNVPSNIYALAVICMGHDGPMEPHLFPAVVGNPMEAFGGSVAGSTGVGGPAAPTGNGGTGSANGSSS